MKEDEMDETYGTAREKRKAYRISVGKPERKIALERGRRKWMDNIKTGLKEIEWKNLDWIYLTRDMLLRRQY